jgi:hypothetical protein
MAGGQVPVAGLDREGIREVERGLVDSVLEHLKVKKTLRQPLYPRDDEKDATAS